MEKSFVFDAVLVDGVYDREYLSEDFCNYFKSFISDGVFPNPSTNLQVMASSNMDIVLNKGKAFKNGRLYENTEPLTFTIEPADGVLNRIDTVVLQVDNLKREFKAVIKKGTFAVNPIPQELLNNADYEELKVAEVYVKAGMIKINQADITDTRLDKNVCGLVSQMVQTVDTSTLYRQIQSDLEKFNTEEKAKFLQWFDGIKTILDENTAGNLLNLINAKADKTTVYTKQETDTKLSEKADSSFVWSLSNKLNTTRTYTLTHNRAEATIIKGLTSDVGVGEKSPDNPYTLTGIETNGATLYSLQSGVADEYNAQTGVLTKRIGKAVINENSNVSLVKINDKNYIRFDAFYVMKNAKLVDRNKIQTNKFITKNPWDDIFGEEYIRNSTIAFEENLVCYMKKDRLKEYTNTSLKEWLSLNPIEVYYELETPETIQLTPKTTYQHTLSDLPTGQGIYQCQFIATADYTEGDTFTGYTAKPTGEETILPDKAFVKGDIVSITVDTVGKKLGFDVGGTSEKKYSTIVIGTSQSGYTAKDVDYLCNGTNDNVIINAAINSLPADGGEIKLLNGTYNISNSITINKNNVTLCGAGKNTVLKKMGRITVIELSALFCEIKQLQINGNKSVYDGVYGIRVTGSNNVIQNVFIRDNHSEAIQLLSGGERNTIINNYLYGCGSGMVINAKHTIIENNIIVGNKNGISTSQTSNLKILNNTVIGNLQKGISIYNTSSSLVSSNYCIDNNEGILIYDYCKRNSIVNNFCIRGTGETADYSPTQYTIRLSGSEVDYMLVANNCISGKNYVSSGGTSNTFVNNKYN